MPLTEQVLKQMEITSSNRKEVVHTNKVSIIDIIEDMEMAEMISESIYSMFSQSRSGIQSSQSELKLIQFCDSKSE